MVTPGILQKTVAFLIMMWYNIHKKNTTIQPKERNAMQWTLFARS